MIKLPFFIPEKELSFRLGRLLVLIEKMSFNKRGTTILNLEKIVILEFLVKYPELLNKILEKETLDLETSEVQSIEALFPNRRLLFDFKQTKKLLLILVSLKLVDAKIDKNLDVFYYINQHGINSVKEFNSNYLKRLGKIIEKSKKIQSQTYTKLNNQIEQHIKYGFRD